MAVPTTIDAERILAGYDLPEGLVVHSRGVSRLSAAAARLLAARGEPIDPELAAAAGLLHDIDKLETRRTREPHGETGARWLREMGHPELADPVRAHPIVRLLDPDTFPPGWAPVVVSLADRHFGRAFMSIDERIDDMARRYPRYAEQLDQARAPAHGLAARVADAAGLEVAELTEHLRVAAEADR